MMNPRYARAIDRRPISAPANAGAALLPIHFLVIAAASFAGGLVAAPFVIGDTIVFFYNPETLALVHTFALGWITAAIMGVMYRYVPALTRSPLRYPRLGVIQLALFFIGVSGMITHFALGEWSGVWSAALVVIASIILFAVNMFACLWTRLGRAAPESGIAISIVFLVAAGCAGFLLALDKSLNFLGGDVISNLGGHAALAAIGWAAMAVCAVSYRMLPAFLLPKEWPARFAPFQIAALTLAIVGLALGLFQGSACALVAGIVVVLAFAAYLAIVARMLSTHRAPLSWPIRHAISGAIFLAITCVIGLVLAQIGAQGAKGARLASIYGTCGLLGFFSNFIIGLSYHLFPGFVAKARSARQWPAKPHADFTIVAPQALVFVAFNSGLVIVCAGFWLTNVAIARAGSALIAAGAILWTAPSLRTLSRAYRPHF